MKKNLLLVICTAILGTAAFAFSKPADSVAEQVTIEGFINWYGNDPFAYAGIKTEEGKIYNFSVSKKAKFTEKDITASQGHLIKVTGVMIPHPAEQDYEALPDGHLEIKTFEIVK